MGRGRCAREKQERGIGDFAKKKQRQRKHVNEESGKRQCKKEEVKRLRNEEVQWAQGGRVSEEEAYELRKN
jgi:hypothetical protein